ncbi:hypothetical protein [Streptomyces sp. NPDC018947]|uniref:hypothetical protein n=1 Tax=Streptomyces sp. NPDC018947 TaxID=3365054 RepID=UPI0037BCF223
MVAFRHTVLVDALPRPWCADAVGVLLDLAGASRAEAGRLLLPDGSAVPGTRLAEGRHLRPGAVYTTEDDAGTVRVRIREWNRHSRLRAAVDVRTPEGHLALQVALHGADRLRLLELSGRAQGAGGRPASTAFWGSAVLRGDAWWAAADQGRAARTPPLHGRLDHRLFRAGIQAVPRPADLGRWEVGVTVTVRGRHLLRPVAAVVLRVARRRLHRSLARELGGMAARWNAALPGLLRHDRDGLRAAVLAELRP